MKTIARKFLRLTVSDEYLQKGKVESKEMDIETILEGLREISWWLVKGTLIVVGALTAYFSALIVLNGVRKMRQADLDGKPAGDVIKKGLTGLVFVLVALFSVGVITILLVSPDMTTLIEITRGILNLFLGPFGITI